MKKAKVPRPTHKQKDKAIEKLLGFVMELRRNEVDQAMFNYFLEEVKANENFKFDKQTRDEFFYWLKQDEIELKEIWVNCAFKVYKDMDFSKQFVGVFFDNYVEKLQIQWNKNSAKFNIINGHFKKFKKAKS